MIAQGIRFDLGMNIATIMQPTGKAPTRNRHAMYVDFGVARILTLAEKGYTLGRP